MVYFSNGQLTLKRMKIGNNKVEGNKTKTAEFLQLYWFECGFESE